ncbi:MAG: hypothetical protein AB1490_07525 [Pseudomonadota bacterium]
MAGVWQPARGKVTLDGASLDQWSAEALTPEVNGVLTRISADITQD